MRYYDAIIKKKNKKWNKKLNNGRNNQPQKQWVHTFCTEKKNKTRIRVACLNVPGGRYYNIYIECRYETNYVCIKKRKVLTKHGFVLDCKEHFLSQTREQSYA